MNRISTFSGLLIFVGLSLFGAFTSVAMTPGLEFTLRYSVMRSKSMVVGRVVRTEAMDITVQQRKSVLVVEDVLLGHHSIGDSLIINWRANEWQPTPDSRGYVFDARSTQLDTMIEKTALWVLSAEKGLWSLTSPLQYKGSSKEDLGALIQFVEFPDTTQSGVRLFKEMFQELESEPSSEINMNVYVDFLQAELKKR